MKDYTSLDQTLQEKKVFNTFYELYKYITNLLLDSLFGYQK